MKYLVNNYNMTYSIFNENNFKFYDYDENDVENIIDNVHDLEVLIKKYNENMYDDFEIVNEISDDYTCEGEF